MADDIRMFTLGNETAFAKGDYYKPIPVLASSTQLQNDYEGNEAAGDQKYLHKEIIVDGKIESINKDIDNMSSMIGQKANASGIISSHKVSSKPK